MAVSPLHRRIVRKGADLERIADSVIAKPEGVPELLEGLSADTAAVRFGCSKVLRLVSEKEPATLQRTMGTMIAMLEHENTFLRCDAIRIVANLTRVDRRGKFESVLDRYFAPIKGPSLILAATTLGSAPTIVRAKPKLTGRIVAKMLDVQRARYKTPECRRIALGQAIDSFDSFFEQIDDPEPVVNLVRRQLRCPRASTKKKAQSFLSRHAVNSRGRARVVRERPGR